MLIIEGVGKIDGKEAKEVSDARISKFPKEAVEETNFGQVSPQCRDHLPGAVGGCVAVE